MNAKTIITCVNTLISESHKLLQDLSIEVKITDNIMDLFSLLIVPTFHTDSICLNITGLDDLEDIHAVSTLLKRSSNKTDIVALVSESTPAILLKEINSSPYIDFVAVKEGGIFFTG